MEAKVMYAIVEIKNDQYKVTKGDKIDVALLNLQKNEVITFDKILMLSKNNNDFIIGRPYIENAEISAKVIGEIKGKKVIAYKYKRRKGYHRKVGHREKYTRIEIESIKYNGEEII